MSTSGGLLEGCEAPAALHWELHTCKKVALIWKKPHVIYEDIKPQ